MDWVLETENAAGHHAYGIARTTRREDLWREIWRTTQRPPSHPLGDGTGRSLLTLRHRMLTRDGLQGTKPRISKPVLVLGDGVEWGTRVTLDGVSPNLTLFEF